jgi:hypothetical protein
MSGYVRKYLECQEHRTVGNRAGMVTAHFDLFVSEMVSFNLTEGMCTHKIFAMYNDIKLKFIYYSHFFITADSRCLSSSFLFYKFI